MCVMCAVEILSVSDAFIFMFNAAAALVFIVVVVGLSRFLLKIRMRCVVGIFVTFSMFGLIRLIFIFDAAVVIAAVNAAAAAVNAAAAAANVFNFDVGLSFSLLELCVKHNVHVFLLAAVVIFDASMLMLLVHILNKIKV